MSDSGVAVCAKDAIDEEDVIHFDHAGKTYAVYRSPEDTYHATDGLCSHEKIHLADGFVVDYEIQCPKHQATFRAPACVNLRTYAVKVEGETVFLKAD